MLACHLVELTNDRNHTLWHAKTGEYCPSEEGWINRVVRFGKVDQAYIHRFVLHTTVCFLRPSSCSRRIPNIISVVERFGWRLTLFLRKDPHALAVLVEAVSDDIQQCLADVRYQLDAPVVAALCPILLFMEYHDDGTFPLLRHLTLTPNADDDIE